MNNEVCLIPEWAPQSGVMLTWPHENSDWLESLDIVEPVYIEIASHISRFESVLIVVPDHAKELHIRSLLMAKDCNLDAVRFYIAPSNDTWARDHGPLTVKANGKLTLLDFTFNGWGNKFDAALDNKINQTIYKAGAFSVDNFKSDSFVMEGGSVESDGFGTILTTSECLSSKERNPSFNKLQIEEKLNQTLGAKRILWLDHGYLAGDDTDSHVDTLARFTDPHTIAYVKCDDPEDEHYPALSAMEQQLKTFTDYQGKPYRLISLPWAKPCFDADDGHRLPATYANFLIINKAVLVPTYNDAEKDNIALHAIQMCFPDREIIGIQCLPLIAQHGSLHCVTMQLPDGVMNV